MRHEHIPNRLPPTITLAARVEQKTVEELPWIVKRIQNIGISPFGTSTIFIRQIQPPLTPFSTDVKIRSTAPFFWRCGQLHNATNGVVDLILAFLQFLI
jgi:hypothetical protein